MGHAMELDMFMHHWERSQFALQKKEAAELAAALASKPPTPVTTPAQSPTPSEPRVRNSAKPPSLQKGTPPFSNQHTSFHHEHGKV